jgi:4-amino-4-deoxy-L-arabinose transferase-like glycosyltransferase
MVMNQKRNYVFPILLGVLFFLRGLQIQCLYPPLEGPDEYQHIAYMVYLIEEHKSPQFGKAMVPKSLYPKLLANPHCTYDWQQTQKIGCLRYEDFYEQQPLRIEESDKAIDIGLYQAQHPPLYYILFSPVFSWVTNSFGFRQAVYTLRLINILLASVAIVCLVSPAKTIFKEKKSILLGMLAISLHPMFMTYVSRVANDPLALVFAGLAVFVLTQMTHNRYLIIKATLIGCLIGLGVLTKLIAFCLLPASLVFLGYLLWKHRISLRKTIICALTIISWYFILTFQYHFQNYSAFGTIFPSSDTVNNAAAGKTFLDVIGQIRLEHIVTYFGIRLVASNLWTSGWSFLYPPVVLIFIFMCILAAALFGLLPVIFIRLRNPAQNHLRFPPNLILCCLIVIFSFGAAYVQALNSISHMGRISTTPYYVMIGYPAFLTCFLAAARGYGKAGPAVIASSLIVFFLAIEYYCVLRIAIPHWANANRLSVIFERLASIHPTFPAPQYFFPLAVIVCGLTLTMSIIAITQRDLPECKEN